MINVGDTVKVIDKADISDDVGRRELYPIGTICKVIEINENCDSADYRVVKLEDSLYAGENSGWWYKADELEIGHLEWIKD